MRFELENKTIEIQPRALVIAGGLLLGLILLMVLLNSGTDDPVTVARNGNSAGEAQAIISAQTPFSTRHSRSTEIGNPDQSNSTQVHNGDKPAGKLEERQPQEDAILSAGPMDWGLIVQAATQKPEDATTAKPQMVASASPPKPTKQYPPHIPLPLAAAAAKAGYEPPSKRDLARLRRDIRNELQKIAGAKIELRDEVPAGKPADPYFAIQQYEAAGGDQRKLAFVLGTQLEVARQLLAAEEIAVRRSGLGIAWYAAGHAASDLKQPRIGRDISIAYLLPNVDAAKQQHWKVFSDEMILKQVVSVSLRAEDYQTMQLSATWLRGVAHNRNVADFARLRIAEAFRYQGDLAAAIATIEEFDDSTGTGMSGAKRYLPQLRDELAEREGKGQRTSAN